VIFALSSALFALLAASAPGHSPLMPTQPPAPLSEIPTDPRPLNVSNEIWYHIMPIAWRHAPVPGTDPQSPQNVYKFGTFKGIEAGIPYLQSLSITGIWLNPIFPSPAYHGYQHGPADTVNPWFGTEDDFRSLVAACHSAGIKVFLDLVTYGISQESLYFKQSYNAPASGYSSMLGFLDSGNTKFIGYDYKTWNGQTVGFIHWDLRRTTAKRQVFEWSKKWLRPASEGGAAIDGYRLDHVWLTYDKGTDGLGYKIDPFWREWRDEVQSVKPDVFTFVEQQDWTSYGTDLLRTASGERVHDAAFTKPFEFAAREALNTENATKLYESMAATLAAIPKGYTSIAIIGDHDVDRIASAINADQHPGRLRAAAAVLMLQPLPPCIYYGDELGMCGVGAAFGGDANDIPRREPMRWDTDDSPITTNYFALNEQAYAVRSARPDDGMSVREQDAQPGSLLTLYRELAKLRASTPALRTGAYVPVSTDSPQLWCFLKQSARGSVLVTINISSEQVKATLSPPPGTTKLPATLTLDGYAYSVTALE
jgi:alpha-amylase